MITTVQVQAPVRARASSVRACPPFRRISRERFPHRILRITTSPLLQARRPFVPSSLHPLPAAVAATESARGGLVGPERPCQYRFIHAQATATDGGWSSGTEWNIRARQTAGRTDIDRHTGKRTHTQEDRQINRQANRHAGRQADTTVPDPQTPKSRAKEASKKTKDLRNPRGVEESQRT